MARIAVESKVVPTFSTFPNFPSLRRPGAFEANHFASLVCQKACLVRDRGGGGGLPLPPSSGEFRRLRDGRAPHFPDGRGSKAEMA